MKRAGLWVVSLYHFTIMERALDAAIGKLFGLEGGAIDIIGSSIPLARKVELLFAAEKFLAAAPQKAGENSLVMLALPWHFAFTRH